MITIIYEGVAPFYMPAIHHTVAPFPLLHFVVFFSICELFNNPDAKETQLDKLSIVIPCHNEQDAIPQVVPRALDCLEQLKTEQKIKDFELIVVDDVSTDASPHLLREYHGVKLIRVQGVRTGYGAALKLGFSQATGDWIGFLDMDNSYRPEDLARFVQRATENSADFIMGQRRFSEKGMSFVRGFGNWFYVFLAQVFFGTDLQDVCSGFRLFHRRHLNTVMDIRDDGLNFSIHLTLKLIQQRVSISPLDIQYDPRIGDSKLSVLGDGFAFLRVLFSLRFRGVNAIESR